MYLPSFYKVQFEKYFFNVKRAGMFAIPVALWGKIFIIFFSRMVILSSILQHSLHWLLPTSQRSPKKRTIRIMSDTDRIYQNISFNSIVFHLFRHTDSLFVNLSVKINLWESIFLNFKKNLNKMLLKKSGSFHFGLIFSIWDKYQFQTIF